MLDQVCSVNVGPGCHGQGWMEQCVMCEWDVGRLTESHDILHYIFIFFYKGKQPVSSNFGAKWVESV